MINLHALEEIWIKSAEQSDPREITEARLAYERAAGITSEPVHYTQQPFEEERTIGGRVKSMPGARLALPLRPVVSASVPPRYPVAHLGVGERIRNLRLIKFPVATHFARAVGITSGSVSGIELGSYLPSLDLVQRMAKVLECEPGALSGGVELRPFSNFSKKRPYANGTLPPGVQQEVTEKTEEQPRTMKWHCLACHKNFQGPTDHTPKESCAHCGSKQIFDVNIARVSPEEAKQIRADVAAGKYVFVPVA